MIENDVVLFIMVFTMQGIFNVARVFEVRWSYDIRPVPLACLTFVMSLVWIVSIAFSMQGVIDGNIWMIVAFVTGSVIGRIGAVTIFKEFAIRPQIFAKLLSKEKKQSGKSGTEL